MSITSTTTRFPFHDASLPIEQRVEDLLSRLTLADKAGLLFHTMAMAGDPEQGNAQFGLPSLASLIRKRHMNHFNVFGSAGGGRDFAAWHNAVQRVAAEVGLGIPVTLSTDPRHSFTNNPGTAMLAGAFSQWPEPLGLAAIGSAELVEAFGDIARQEYTAVGLRVALHPQIDLATEPRWSRQNGTFGEDAGLTSKLVVAYIRGFQGDTLGASSVATMVKHFPGGGPQKDGEDPHFDYGREQVYPGGEFEYHLKPFEAAIAAGGSQMMPYYGMPIGTQYDEVGFGFNKSVVTGLLRERYGFDGIVCTDWGLLTDVEIMGHPLAARAWGVEHLSRPERLVLALEAGIDQFGGEICTDVLIGEVSAGHVSEARVDASIRRILREKFTLGLFENPLVDEERAEIVVGNRAFVEAGLAAQRDSITVLTNGKQTGTAPTLPLAKGLRIYGEGVSAEALADYGTVVESPDRADVAILRISAPYDTSRTKGFESFFHAGSLEFEAAEIERLQGISRAVPSVLDVYLDRPAILTPLVDEAAAIVANFGSSDGSLLAVLFGDAEPKGSLPFDVPRSMAAVEASREDVPFDTADPLFRFGHGLRY
ncbi:glycoside hydrolase family 3 protein [Subtercola lobariae]|uniref:beta-glucosidase n=1 Tax=Subtercola lobariae TaxID=1588641 RepID=A0A917F0F8_9MICO|nr:glycoside hydrolase family 3 N-terminal domain-containing protein [Subtercola lobariae]GGF30392.1 beta-glucosidase [Subtercola lobariae]